MHYCVLLPGKVGDVCLNTAKEGLKYNKQTVHRSSEHTLRRHYAALPIAACQRNVKGNMKRCLLLSDFISHVSTGASGKYTDQRIARMN